MRPGFNPREVQKVVDHVQQVSGAFLNVGYKPRVRRRERPGGLLTQEVGVTDDGVERRPQFMAAARQKLALHAVDALHFTIAAPPIPAAIRSNFGGPLRQFHPAFPPELVRPACAW